MGFCTVCFDEQAGEGFACPQKACKYELCPPCMKLAFEDSTGDNYGKCPLCKTPTARDMMESLCGAGSVRAVERELRPKVEFEVKMENLKKAQGKEEMSEMKQRAQSLIHVLSEKLNMTCPRCSMVFDEYDGCNALTCGNESCKAAFCAVCLEDCGSNAHPHVRSQHGNLFDKEAFYIGKKTRELAVLELFIEDIKEEPFEVKELVRINCESSFPDSSHTGGGSARDTAFVESARQSVSTAIKNDRLSLLSDPQDAGQQVIRIGDVSPRNAVPDEYRLRLHGTGIHSPVCRITLEQLNHKGLWEVIPLPKESGETEESKNQGDRAKVDALVNIRGALQCGVVAFHDKRQLYQSRSIPTGEKGRLGDDEVSLMFCAVSRDGGLVGEKETLSGIGCSGQDILGLNQNQRLTILDRHCQETGISELLFDPLRHYIGSGTPQRVFREISVPAPDTFKELNQEQQRVAHPLALTTAMEVAGPPGSGKTKTITELVRSILECTDYHVIVLSERNGAIDAIADKFADDCVERNRRSEVGKVTHLLLWNSLMSFGSSGSMGSSTKLFTLGEKLKWHPELVELRRILDKKRSECRKLKETMLTTLSKAIEGLEEFLPEGAEPWKRIRLVESGSEAGLTRAAEIVGAVADARQAIQPLIETGLSALNEKQVDDVCLTHSSILGHLVPVRTDGMRKERAWNVCRKEVRLALVKINTCLEFLVKSNTFSLSNAEKLEFAARQADESLKAATQRLEVELVNDARVLLSTIGSSHKLPVGKDEGEDDDDGLSGVFGGLKISNCQNKKTVVVFDEAGCIPSYEFLGLSRLGRSIESLVCVGDKNQLPPYDPNSSRDYSKNRNGHRGAYGKQRSVTQETTVKSLLDACKLTPDTGKIKLTNQYRVPRDIAGLLDARIYLGDYRTAPECQVPSKGFHFMDIPEDRRQGGKKYVNDAEVQHCLELVRQSKREGRESIMVLTPYKKQQRELQFKFKRNGYDDVAILTIDQCQGQEADIVIISMVQKPTRFLNKNRLNVALSRVRQKLYFLADKRQFREASGNANWDCSLLAKDLLQLAGNDDDCIY